MLKGVSVETIAEAIDTPVETVSAFMAGRKVPVAAATARRIGTFLGIDMDSARLLPDMVHVFDCANVGKLASRPEFERRIGAIGVLLRESKAGRLKFKALRMTARPVAGLFPIHVVQNDFFSAVVFGAPRLGFVARFDTRFVPDCQWVIPGKERRSTVPVTQKALCYRLLKREITGIEFNEIFEGRNARTWSDVEAASIENQVAKVDLIQWIQLIGQNRKAVRAINRPTETVASPDESPSQEPQQAVAGG
jgi:hypothetical protein